MRSQTRLMDTDGASSRLYLHTSPEFACKKLLAAGEQKIFTFAPVFRNRERGPLHHPEFTMLEWYRAGEPYTGLMADCAELLRVAAEAAGRRMWSWNDVQADVMLPPQRVTVAQAFEHLCAASGFWRRSAERAADRDLLARAAAEAGHRVADDDTWADIFSRIMTRIEPMLGVGAHDGSGRISNGGGRPRPAVQRTTRASRSASSCMPAAWSWRTGLAS